MSSLEIGTSKIEAKQKNGKVYYTAWFFKKKILYGLKYATYTKTMSLPFYFIFFVEKVRAVPCGLRYYVAYTFVFRWSSSRIFFSYLFFYFNILYIIFYSPLLLRWRASLGVSLPNKTLTKLFLTFSLLQFCRSLSRQRKENGFVRRSTTRRFQSRRENFQDQVCSVPHGWQRSWSQAR